ncbi:MAG: RnfABCDGE type electron transport complex subunit G [Candidatus Aminicenantes bacterium]|nr:RnfABCDGE type electron transport complex subunit G [Candidatus Aminicenantes bacterium]
MKQYLKMVIVLTAIAAVCGFLLAAVKNVTGPRIEEQIMVNVKGPAVKRVLETSTNDLIADRREVTIDGQVYTLFIGKKDGQPWALAYESKGGGFGGDIGVMVGYDLAKDTLTGIGILTHQETPGLGSRVTEPAFTDNFKDKSIKVVFKVKKDGGKVDAVSGATNSSRGVCEAVSKSIAIYPAVKEKAAAKQ